jgi:hypothetical protein
MLGRPAGEDNGGMRSNETRSRVSSLNGENQIDPEALDVRP